MKRMKKMNNYLFDMSPAFGLLALGIPVLLIVFVVFLIFVAIKLISGAHKNDDEPAPEDKREMRADPNAEAETEPKNEEDSEDGAKPEDDAPSGGE